MALAAPLLASRAEATVGAAKAFARAQAAESAGRPEDAAQFYVLAHMLARATFDRDASDTKDVSGAAGVVLTRNFEPPAKPAQPSPPMLGRERSSPAVAEPALSSERRDRGIARVWFITSAGVASAAVLAFFPDWSRNGQERETVRASVRPSMSRTGASLSITKRF